MFLKNIAKMTRGTPLPSPPSPPLPLPSPPLPLPSLPSLPLVTQLIHSPFQPKQSPSRGHTDPLFKSERILKITDLYKLHVSLFMFDLQSGALPTSFKQFIPRDANDYTSTIITRQHDNIHRQRPRTTFSSKLPKHNFIKIWNSIDESTRNKKSRHIFKCILTKQFIAQYKTNVKCTNRRCRDCYNNT